jgi:hypothetical protein
VFVARLLPVVRTFIALPAGIARMPQLRFHIYTFLGSWPWCFALAYVGMRLGRSWETDPRFKEVFHSFHLGVEALLALPLSGSYGRTGSSAPPSPGPPAQPEGKRCYPTQAKTRLEWATHPFVQEEVPQVHRNTKTL